MSLDVTTIFYSKILRGSEWLNELARKNERKKDQRKSLIRQLFLLDRNKKTWRANEDYSFSDSSRCL